MTFLCGDMSEGRKCVKGKTSHTLFSSPFHPTAQATGTERCPVKIYKEFARHRPLQINKPDSPFYLAVKHQRKPDDDVWYM